jgi:hypothetical protein
MLNNIVFIYFFDFFFCKLFARYLAQREAALKPRPFVRASRASSNLEKEKN